MVWKGGGGGGVCSGLLSLQEIIKTKYVGTGKYIASMKIILNVSII